MTSSATDVLTGISNRRGFEALANKSLAITRRLGAPTTLLSFDLDHFKEINDSLGHAAGDRALVDFSRTLINTFRDADAIARLGGDEFCVLACGTAATMSSPLERLETNLAALTDRPYRIRFSVGTTEYNAERHDSLEDLLSEADRTMFVAKRDRKARFAIAG